MDTSVLGIGERNGITPLGIKFADMYVFNSLLKTRKVDLWHE